MKELDAPTERLVWVISGVLAVVWMIAMAVNFWSPDVWSRLPASGSRYSPLILGSLLVLVNLIVAWLFYRMGLGELRKKAETERQLRQALEDVYRGTLQTLTMTLDERDGETAGHSHRVMRYSLSMGRQCGLTSREMQTLAWGALLHDLGKIGISDAILRKPGPLSPDEMKKMREHVGIGFQMVSSIPFLSRASLVVRHHHERYDGGGYPDGLRGEEIPFLARIFSVADAFDAMTSSRPYRRAPFSVEKALTILMQESGWQFCPKAVQAFARLSVEEIDQIRMGGHAPIEEMGPLVGGELNGELLSGYYQDVLTGTKNRTAWEAKKAQMAKIRGIDLGTLVFLDVDGLKRVNDTHGHDIGDRVLADLGGRLVRLTADVFRVGGDEFVLWYPPERWSDETEQEIYQAISDFAACWGHMDPGPSVSLGAAASTTESESLLQLQVQADKVMYRQKSARHGGIQPESPAV